MIIGECWKLAISLVRLAMYKGPNSAALTAQLPQNSKVTRFIGVLIVLGIYNFAWKDTMDRIIWIRGRFSITAAVPKIELCLWRLCIFDKVTRIHQVPIIEKKGEPIRNFYF